MKFWTVFIANRQKHLFRIILFYQMDKLLVDTVFILHHMLMLLVLSLQYCLIDLHAILIISMACQDLKSPKLKSLEMSFCGVGG